MIAPDGDQSFFVKWEPTAVPNVGRVIKYGMMEKKFIVEDENFLMVDEAVMSGDCYVDLASGEVNPKGPSTATLTGSKIGKLPAGATVTFEGSTVTADGATVQLEFDQPGTYRVVVRSPTQLDQMFDVVWE